MREGRVGGEEFMGGKVKSMRGGRVGGAKKITL